MTWQEQLGRVQIGGKQRIGGSFRGAAFYCDSHSLDGGRRIEVHEYPARDEPFAEDLGRAARRLSISAYVVGRNYLSERDDLIAALESDEGPGILEHPYLGSRQVACTGFSVSESRDDGGMAKFDLNFVETEELPRFPSVSVDIPSTINLQGDLALLTLRAGFVANYDPSTIASAYLSPIADAVSGFARQLSSPGSGLLSEAQDLALFRARIDGAVNRAASIVRDGALLYDTITDLLAFTFRAPTIPEPIAALLALIDTEYASLPTSPALSRSREKQAELFDLVLAMLRVQVLVRTTRLGVEASFPVFTEARSVRDMLLMRYDSQLDGELDDDMFALLTDLRRGILGSIPDTDETVSDLADYVVRGVENSLTISQRLYGNSSKELQICDRNALKYPGVIPDGTALEVIVV